MNKHEVNSIKSKELCFFATGLILLIFFTNTKKSMSKDIHRTHKYTIGFRFLVLEADHLLILCVLIFMDLFFLHKNLSKI